MKRILAIILTLAFTWLSGQNKFVPTYNNNFYVSILSKFIEHEKLDTSKFIIAIFNESTLFEDHYILGNRFIPCYSPSSLLQNVTDFNNTIFVSVSPLRFNAEGRLECIVNSYTAEIVPYSNGIVSFTLFNTKVFFYKNFSDEAFTCY